MPNLISKPIVNFKSTLPLVVSCGTLSQIVISVLPNAVGPCKVILKLHPNFRCKFEDGSSAKVKTIQVNDPVQVIDCVFTVKMICPLPTNYYTLFFTQAVNGVNKKSFVKPGETIIRCE